MPRWVAKKLNAKQKAVADAYLVDPARQQTDAYLKVYQCTRQEAATAASRLFRQPVMKAYLEAKLAPKLKQLDVTQERILREMAAIAYLDPAELYDERGRLLPIRQLPEQVRRALTLDYDRRGRLRPRAIDKAQALKLLAQTQRMLVERVGGDPDSPPLQIVVQFGKKDG